MDREQFDALARSLGTRGSRRGAVGLLMLLAGALRGAPAAADRKRRAKPGQAAAKRCFGAAACGPLLPGQRFDRCDLSGISARICSGCDFRGADLGGVDFHGGDFSGASFRETNLRQANLSGANLSGASFRDACLAGADLSDADTTGAHFRGAIFCGTIGRAGQVIDRDCGADVPCCPPCRSIGAACSGSGRGSCCSGRCRDGVCQAGCDTDAECGGSEPFCCHGACTTQCCSGSQCPRGLCSEGQCVDCIDPGDCPPEQNCVDGVCVAGCANDEDCGEGETCCEGSCCAAACSCEARVPGPGRACVDFTGGCSFPCASDGDCDRDHPGWVCVEDLACPEVGAHCHPRCGTDAALDRGAGRRLGLHD